MSESKKKVPIFCYQCVAGPDLMKVEVEDGVGTIRLDRPPMNALSRQVQAEISESAREAAARADVGAVVVYGGPKVFAAGADIIETNTFSATSIGQSEFFVDDPREHGGRKDPAFYQKIIEDKSLNDLAWEINETSARSVHKQSRRLHQRQFSGTD